MNNIVPWLQATKDHLVKHWQVHLVPLLIVFAGGMVIGLVLTALFMCSGIFVSIVAGATESGLATLLMVVVLFGLCILFTVVLSFLLMPIYIGYVRVVLRAHRGEPPDKADMFWGVRNIGQVMLLMLLQAVLGFGAAMLCYFPALIVSAALMFSIPAMVDRDLGAIEAMKASWELVKPRFLEIIVLIFALFAVIMILSYVPIVGPFVGSMAYIGAMVVVYDDLVRRDHFEA